jgi:hypothetical protein
MMLADGEAGAGDLAVVYSLTSNFLAGFFAAMLTTRLAEGRCCGDLCRLDMEAAVEHPRVVMLMPLISARSQPVHRVK